MRICPRAPRKTGTSTAAARGVSLSAFAKPGAWSVMTDQSTASPRLRSQETPRAEAHGAARGDDDMIEHADPDRLSDLRETTRDAEVLVARLGIAARMVVDQHDAGGGVEDGGAEDLARMDDRRVETADRDRLPALQLVARVEEQHDEVLAPGARQIAHVRQHVLGSADRAAGERSVPGAATQLEGGGERSRAGHTHPRHAHPAGGRPFGELA